MSEPSTVTVALIAQVAVRRVGIVQEAVDEALGLVRPVGQLLDLAAQHPLRVVHQVLARGLHGLDAVALDELHEALGADPAGRDLRLHVADDELRRRARCRAMKRQIHSLRRPSS